MRLLYYLSKLLALRFIIRINWEKKSSVTVLDRATFPECHSKVVPVWSWKQFKHKKRVVHFKNDKYHIAELG